MTNRLAGEHDLTYGRASGSGSAREHAIRCGRRIDVPSLLVHASIVCAIVAGHGWVLRLADTMFFPAAPPVSGVDVFTSETWTLVQSSEWDTTPLPEFHPGRIPMSLDALQTIQFEVEDEAGPGGVIAPTSAPRLSRVQFVSVQQYAQRAHVQPGRPVTVVVSLEVLDNGAVGSVQVVRSCGDLEQDGVAVEYARQLHWIAGTVNQTPQVMRVIFPVTLTLAQPVIAKG